MNKIFGQSSELFPQKKVENQEHRCYSFTVCISRVCFLIHALVQRLVLVWFSSPLSEKTQRNTSWLVGIQDSDSRWFPWAWQSCMSHLSGCVAQWSPRLPLPHWRYRLERHPVEHVHGLSAGQLASPSWLHPGAHCEPLKEEITVSDRFHYKKRKKKKQIP